MLDLEKWTLVRPPSKSVESRFLCNPAKHVKYVVTKKVDKSRKNYTLEIWSTSTGKWTSAGRFDNKRSLLNRLEAIDTAP